MGQNAGNLDKSRVFGQKKNPTVSIIVTVGLCNRGDAIVYMLNIPLFQIEYSITLSRPKSELLR